MSISASIDDLESSITKFADAIKGEFGERTTDINGLIQQLSVLVKDLQAVDLENDEISAAATAAKTAADNAAASASAATITANTAKTSAGSAISIAVDAISKANTADSTANNALTKANTAQTTADAAAIKAQSAADTAAGYSTLFKNVETTANQAQYDASVAQVSANANATDIANLDSFVRPLVEQLASSVSGTAISITLTNGIIIKAGTIDVSGSQGYWGGSLFETAFPQSCFAVFPCTGQRADALAEWQFLTVAAKYAAGFDWCIRTFNVDTNTWTSGATNVRVYYFAIGR